VNLIAENRPPRIRTDLDSRAGALRVAAAAPIPRPVAIPSERTGHSGDGPLSFRSDRSRDHGRRRERQIIGADGADAAADRARTVSCGCIFTATSARPDRRTLKRNPGERKRAKRGLTLPHAALARITSRPRGTPAPRFLPAGGVLTLSSREDALSGPAVAVPGPRERETVRRRATNRIGGRSPGR
jgi:hypothetical protein